MSNFFTEIRRLLKFGLVGAATAAIYFLVLAFQLEIIRVNYNLAVSVAYVTSVIFQFFANKYFTFSSKSTSFLSQLPKYLVLLFVNYLITIFVVRFFVVKLGFTVYFGVLAAVPLIAMVGYLLSKHWIFKGSYVNG